VVAAVLTAAPNGHPCTPVTLPWWQLRRQHVNAVRAWLVEHRKPATGNRIMAALRATLKECWRLDLMTVETYQRAIDVKSIRGEGPSQAAGRALKDGEKTAILAACRADDSPAGPRDAAIFGLAVYAGLRRAEIAGLHLEDYNADDQVMRVLGKGNKTRSVPLTGGLVDVLDEWLALRAQWAPAQAPAEWGPSGNEAGFLFLAVNKGGRVLDKGISDAAIHNLLLKRAQQAGVKRFTPHDGRRTFAGDVLDAGADVIVVQKLMGHADANTTGKYDRRGERAKAQAVNRLHMSWNRR
jgi:integrase